MEFPYYFRFTVITDIEKCSDSDYCKVIQNKFKIISPKQIFTVLSKNTKNS